MRLNALNLSVASAALVLASRRATLLPVPSLALVEDWRMPATVATSSGISGSQTALAAAQAAANAKGRPSFTVASGATEYVEWTVGTAGTALLTWLGMTYTATVQITKQGAAVPYAIQSVGAQSTQGDLVSGVTGSRRQFVKIGVQAGDVIRMTVTAGAGASETMSPLVHNYPENGLVHSYLIFGASREQLGFGSKSLEDAIIAAYPTVDPIIFNIAYGGQALDAVKTNVVNWASTYVTVTKYAYGGSIAGNSISNVRPYPNDTSPETIAAGFLGTINALKAAGYPTDRIVTSNTSFRWYKAAPVLTLPDFSVGSTPYNQNIVDPIIRDNLAHAFDTTLLRARVDEESQTLYHKEDLNTQDGVHDAYQWSRENWVSSVIPWIRTGSWPAYTNRVDAVISAAEASIAGSDTVVASQAAYDKADLAWRILVASAAKTAFQARVATANKNMLYKTAVGAYNVANATKTQADKTAAQTAVANLRAAEGDTTRALTLKDQVDGIVVKTLFQTVKLVSATATAPDATFNAVSEGTGSQAAGVRATNLKNTDGVDTGWTYGLDTTINITVSTNTLTGFTSQVPEVPTSALAKVFTTNSTNPAIYFGGLDNSKRYNIKFMATRTNQSASVGTRLTSWTCNGQTTPQLLVEDNMANFVQLTNLAPVSGKLSITLNKGAYGYAFTGVYIIEEVSA